MSKPWTAEMKELDRLATVTREVWMMSITKKAPEEVIHWIDELTGDYEDKWVDARTKWLKEE